VQIVLASALTTCALGQLSTGMSPISAEVNWSHEHQEENTEADGRLYILVSLTRCTSGDLKRLPAVPSIKMWHPMFYNRYLLVRSSKSGSISFEPLFFYKYKILVFESNQILIFSKLLPVAQWAELMKKWREPWHRPRHICILYESIHINICSSDGSLALYTCRHMMAHEFLDKRSCFTYK
jgi:hypothetical protein